MRLYFSLLFLSIAIVATTQTTYKTTAETPVVKVKTISLSEIELPDAFVQHIEYPKPGGKYYHEFLARQKEKSANLFPKTNITPQFRAAVDTPELLNDFPGNSWSGGIPLDNHMATNNDGLIITVVNTQMVILENTGFYRKVFNLNDFWAPLGEAERYFDPRIIYDPVADRFIVAMMQDYDCDGSNIVFAFTATNDPTGDWHLYQFEGCPKTDATFADFPMISITENELFFTYNAVYQDSSWQTGFAETLIYQIDKNDGYNGNDLNWRSWSDINLDGRQLRYMCPIKYATPEMGPEVYFMSNRSFDVQNDTIWMVHINGALDHPDLQLDVQYMLSPVPYGVPPNAEQPKDRLQTNDARVLDGFIIEDQIQFVSSTVDPATGLSAIFHGIVENVSTNPGLIATILGDATQHRAYPGIAYTGINPDERDAIIIALHASPDRFPGYSGLYYNFDHSEWMTIKEGQRNIDMFKVDNPFGVDPTLERWGDYTGIQPQYDEEGTVYTAAVYGKPGNVNDTWVGYLSRPGVASSTQEGDRPEATVTTFPNPTSGSVTIDVELNAVGQLLEAHLYDMSGRHIEQVFSQKITNAAPFRFLYKPSDLASGSYVVNLTLDGVLVGSELLIVR